MERIDHTKAIDYKNLEPNYNIVKGNRGAIRKQNKDDFINIFDYQNRDYPFQIFIGGRGTGKTYSALNGVTDIKDSKFIFMRRTGAELDLLLDSDKGEGVNPFKPINADKNINLGLRSIVKNVAGVYHREVDESGKLIHTGAPIGYGLALSTLSNVRGVDLNDCTNWIYDEFIPEQHVRKIKNEYTALMNAYETICRNREFIDLPPINLWMLANSNDIDNPIFIGLGIVAEVEKMRRQKKHHRYIKDRGLAIHLLKPKESFVAKKKETALYKLTKGTEFYEMALANDFSYNDFSMIGYKNLKGYVPLCSIDNATIYKKKGSGEFYICYARATCEHFTMSDQGIIAFKLKYGCILQPYFVEERITFETYELKAKIQALIL